MMLKAFSPKNSLTEDSDDEENYSNNDDTIIVEGVAARTIEIYESVL